eukprot:3899910-Prymnesium_polylepis.1
MARGSGSRLVSDAAVLWLVLSRNGLVLPSAMNSRRLHDDRPLPDSGATSTNSSGWPIESATARPASAPMPRSRRCEDAATRSSCSTVGRGA